MLTVLDSPPKHPTHFFPFPIIWGRNCNFLVMETQYDGLQFIYLWLDMLSDFWELRRQSQLNKIWWEDGHALLSKSRVRQQHRGDPQKFGGIRSFGCARCDGFYTLYRFNEQNDQRRRGCEIVETKWNYLQPPRKPWRGCYPVEQHG